MQANEILDIPLGRAASIFPGDAVAVGAEFRKLLKTWHPDVCKDPKAGDVVAHLTALRDRLVEAPAKPDGVLIALAGGRALRFHALRSREFDAGEIHVGSKTIAYRVVGEFPDRIPAFSFPDDRLRKEMERFLPQVRKVEDTPDGRLHVFVRTPDQFLLSDVMAALGPLDPLHVAWIVSGMLNIATFLDLQGIGHGGIAPDVLLISPKYHSVALTGPFVFATRKGKRPKSLPERTLDAVPRIAVKGEAMDASIDLELVRLTARECLGVRSPSQLLTVPGLPEQVAVWLASSPAATAMEDYASWERARDAGFGPRRFVKWDIPPDRIYPS